MPQAEETFQAELELIGNCEIRNLVLEILRLAPSYFWRVPSSPSGEHHPSDEHGLGGKVLHTKRAAYVAYQLARMDNLDSLRSDLLLGAMLVHDICSQGLGDAPSDQTDPDHPLLVRRRTDSLRGMPYYKDLMAIVEAHMGRWGPVSPKSRMQWLAHVADYISSREKVKIDLSDATSRIRPG